MNVDAIATETCSRPDQFTARVSASKNSWDDNVLCPLYGVCSQILQDFSVRVELQWLASMEGGESIKLLPRVPLSPWRAWVCVMSNSHND